MSITTNQNQQITISKILDDIHNEAHSSDKNDLNPQINQIKSSSNHEFFTEKSLNQFYNELPASNKPSLNSLLEHEDQKFLYHVYKNILDRKPDPLSIKHYLHLLRIGRISRIEVIGDLLRSKEKNILTKPLKGIWWRYMREKIFKVPLIGYLLDLLYVLVTLQKQKSKNKTRLSKQNADHLKAMAEIYAKVEQLEYQLEKTK